MKINYEYHLLTWGGFYNDQYKLIHKYEPGDYWFDSKIERQRYIDKLEEISEKLHARMLCIDINEGYNTRIKTILHRVVEYKGQLIYSNYNMGYAYPYSAAAYHMEWKWTPGGNDETVIDDEKDIKDVRIVQEWITGAFDQNSDY